MDENAMSTKEASAFLGFAEKTLNSWRSQGRGPPYVRIGEKGPRCAIAYRMKHLVAWRDKRAEEESNARR